ncbi:MAG: DUF4860 domain-containing protein [Clostridiales bacterium]|nr:DUF4860 domain-containing protein [Clostridiales bacterium]
MRKEQREPLHSYIIALLGIFALGFLLLVLFGTRVYLNTVAGQRGNDDRRALMTYLATAVHAYDEQGAILLGTGPEGDALILRDVTADGTYEHRIYLYQGNLVEEYTVAEEPLSPDTARQLGQTDAFFMKKEGESLFRVQTDQGSILLHLRSGEVG